MITNAIVKPYRQSVRLIFNSILLSSLFFSASLSARTLIFQSEEETVRPAPVEREMSSSSSVAVERAPEPQDSPAYNPPVNKYVAPVVVRNASSANSELFFMVEQLQEELNSLRGLVEEQANQIRHLKRNAKSRYMDLDTRLLSVGKRLEANKAPARKVAESVAPVNSGDAGLAAAITTTQANSAEDGGVAPSEEAQAAYQAAYGLIKDREFDQAVKQFYLFIEKYPDGPLTGNAYYWLGEIYLVLPQLEQAKQAFSIVVQAYPGHSKVADALFKLGVAYDRLQDPTESQRYLTEVQRQFPQSTAAKLAKSYKINR
jgi:tol-pal system protein YbgF